MDIQEMISSLMKHPDSVKMGMIASHLGIVRETSREGLPVDHIDVTYEQDKVDEIIRDMESLPGIVSIKVKTSSGRLSVGDALMAVAVGGDIRDNVFPALIKTVDRIKTEACKKKEVFMKKTLKTGAETWV